MGEVDVDRFKRIIRMADGRIDVDSNHDFVCVGIYNTQKRTVTSLRDLTTSRMQRSRSMGVRVQYIPVMRCISSSTVSVLSANTLMAFAAYRCR